MLYQYKGINSEGDVVRGVIDAEDGLSAIREVKSSGIAVVLVDLQKTIDKPFINKIRTQYIESATKSDNKTRDKQIEKELKILQKRQAFLSGSAPLKQSPLKKTLTKLMNSELSFGKKKPVVATLDEEALKRIENIFSEKRKVADDLEEVDFNEKVEEYEEKLKIDEKVMNRLREKIGDKEINWDLIKDVEPAAVSKKDRKIKVKPKELFLFTRRLQIMLSSGVSLLKALMILRDSTHAGLSKIVDKIINMIQSGSSFSEALSRFPNQFNHIYVALVSVGESSGSLERCLLDILVIQEQQMMIKKKLKSATVYPAVIGVVLIIALIGASVFFIPSFEAMFLDQGMELPALTKIVFGVADLLPYIFGFLFAFIMAFSYAKKKISAVDRFWKKYYHKALLSMPVIGKVSNASYMFTFSSTVALMLGNGIRLKDTLGLAYRAINNVYIKNGIVSASGLMVRGYSFSEALNEQKNFDPILVNIVETGEESGRMNFALEQISKYYKEDLERQIEVLMELVQPITMLLIGVLVGPVIIAVYMPILDMSSGALGN